MSIRPKIKTASIINGKYMAFRKLGAGGCGVVYEVALLKCPQKRYAFKAETTLPDEDPTLPMEYDVVKLLGEKNSQHVVEILEKGKCDNYSFIVMTLLGPSLDSIRTIIPVKRFSTFTTLVMILQALDSLKEVHDIGYIHRDVKPANFAIGRFGTPKQKLLHVLDFGIARQYMRIDPIGKQILRKPRRIVPFRGTLKYCSLGAQDRKEQGRHDDLWSLFYMLFEFSIGRLPWTGFQDEDQVKNLKTNIDDICNELPTEFGYFGRHLAVLNYHTAPNYVILRQLLTNVFIKRNFNGNMKLDWEKGGRFGEVFERKSSILPVVTFVDKTEVDLGKIIEIPKEVKPITLDEVVMVAEHAEPSPISVLHDDTLCENNFSPGVPIVDHSLKNLSKETGSVTPLSTKQRKYAYKVPSVTNQKVAEEEERWKKKLDAQKKEKIKKRAESARRSKQDMIIPDDATTEKHTKSKSVRPKKKKFFQMTPARLRRSTK